MNLRTSDGLSEANVRLEARLTTASSKEREQTRFLDLHYIAHVVGA